MTRRHAAFTRASATTGTDARFDGVAPGPGPAGF